MPCPAMPIELRELIALIAVLVVSLLPGFMLGLIAGTYLDGFSKRVAVKCVHLLKRAFGID